MVFIKTHDPWTLSTLQYARVIVEKADKFQYYQGQLARSAVRTRCLVHVGLIECDGRRVVGMHEDEGRAAFQLCGDKSFGRRRQIWVAGKLSPLLDDVLCCCSHVWVCWKLRSTPPLPLP